MNELLAGSRNAKGSWNHYNALKQRYYGQIRTLCQAKGVPELGPGHWTFLFIEPDRRRDPDNICSGGIKLLFDSFVGAGVMKGDSWAHVLGFRGFWGLSSGRAGCLVHFDEARTLEREGIWALFEKEVGGNADKKDRK